MPLRTDRPAVRILLLAGAAFVLCGAAIEFYNLAWGTGTWLGEFSFKWGMAFGAFVVAGIALLAFWGILLSRRIEGSGRAWTEKIPVAWRWILAASAVAIPILLLQYSAWGAVIDGPYLRILIWGLCIAALTVTIPLARETRGAPGSLLLAILVSGSAFIVAAALTEVTSYPFSLGWSEGNRLWDYSLLFGRRLYSFEPGQEPFAYLDIGRQLIGGLPFLLPRVSILGRGYGLLPWQSCPMRCSAC